MPDLFAPLPGKTHLGALTYQFEYQPARTLHPHWAERLIPFQNDWWRSKVAEPRISAYLLRRLDLPPAFSTGRRIEVNSLLLLPPEILHRLTRLSGAVLLAPSLRSIIDGNSLRTLTEAIGPGFLHLIRTLAPFLWRRDMQYQREDGETWLEAIDRAGVLNLAAATQNETKGALGRLRLKMDPRHGHHFEEPAAAADERHAFQLMKKLLLREVDPQWAPLF